MSDSGNQSIVDAFLNKLKRAPASLLMLDYDGTLAPFQTDRHRAYPYPGVIPVLDRILDTGKTKVSVVSGRPIAEIQSLLHPLTGIEMWGAHGLEHMRADGVYGRAEIDPAVAGRLAQAAQWLRGAGLEHLAETKPGGIAFHWRGLSEDKITSLKNRVDEGWRAFTAEPGIKLLRFDGGLELRAAHPDKGDAVAAILKTAGSDIPAAFLGDDDTDEDAFQALGRRGVSILVRSEYRETKANVWLRPPVELIEFLKRWSKAL